ncbi:MAG: hypothetical protein KY442_12340 [Proteobacteria bacterium]|nr:hypothetical protein [Pseudomonadota bacterium]
MKLLPLTALVALLAVTGCASSREPAELPALVDAVSPAPGVVSAGRLEPADIGRVRAAGIRHVIDLTPDAETPDFDEATAVRAAGLAYSNLPLRGPVDLTRENALAFDALVRDAKRPVLVHCASGNRVGAMAALRAAWVEGHQLEEAVLIGKAWGLKGLEGEVRRRIGSDGVRRGSNGG